MNPLKYHTVSARKTSAGTYVCKAVVDWISTPRAKGMYHHVKSNVADPDPSDPYVSGPPGSEPGSISHKYDPDPSITKQK